MKLSEHIPNGAIIICLKAYLASLEAKESLIAPDKRRHIPTLNELAEKIELHPVSLSSIANNKIKRISLGVLATIIHKLRDAGFDTDVDDILQYVEDERIFEK